MKLHGYREGNLYFPFFLIVSSLLFAFFIGFGNPFEYYSSVWILPFGFSIICLLCINTISHCYKNMISLMVILLYYLRDSVAILFLFLGNYSSPIKPTSTKEVSFSIVLMLLETAVVFGGIVDEQKKNNKIGIENDRFIAEREIRNSKLTGVSTIILIVLFGIVVFLWLNSPTVRVYYVSAYTEGAASYNYLEYASHFTIFDNLFMLLFSVIRVIIPVLVISAIGQRFRQETIGILTGIIFLLIELLFMTSQTVDVLLVDAVICLVLLKLYPHKKKFLLSIMVVTGIIGIIYLFQQKLNLSSFSFSDVSEIFQSYIPGVANLTGVYRIEPGNRLRLMLNELLVSIPFGSAIGDRVTDLFRQAVGIRGHIIPYIGEMYVFLGWFAPVGLLIVLKIAYFFYNKANKEVHIVNYAAYIYSAILFAVSMTCYHTSILGQKFFMGALELILIAKFLTRRKNK